MRINKRLRTGLWLLVTPVLLSGRGTAAATVWSVPAWTPVDQVQLQGPWENRFERGCTRLHKPPLDDPGYVLADVALDRKRIFTNYSGDISGRTIGVEAFLAPRSPKEAAYLRMLIAALPALQKPDGHFGAKQHLPKIDRAIDMPILWGNGRLLIGLLEAYQETGNPVALSVARKMGDYFVRTDPIYCRAENLKTVGGDYADAFSTCYFSCIEGLVALARDTGDMRYRRQAERIATLALTVKRFDNLHAHGRLTALRGILDLYELTGTPKWLAGVERDWRTIFARYRLPTGGITERFSRNDERDEGCAEADWLRLNLGLWRITGQERYLDEAQYCLNNHFLYNQYASGGSGHRLLRILNGEPVAFRSGGTEAYWCCCEHWPRAMVDVLRLAITRAPDGVRVNLFLDANATVASAGTRWRVESHEIPDGLRVRLTPEAPVQATLHLRRPSWARGAQVQAGGDLTVSAASNEWRIRGRWDGSQTVTVHWPPRVRREPAPGGGSVLVRGDDLLVAHAVPMNAWLFQGDPHALPILAWPSSGERTGQNGLLRVQARLAGSKRTDASAWHELELAPMRQRHGEFPHSCWFTFDVTSSPIPQPVAHSTTVRSAYLTATATAPCRVWLDGREAGRSSSWQQPIDGFEPIDSKGPHTLLIVCDSTATAVSSAPGVIAAVCTGWNAVRTTQAKGWRVAALTPAEAKTGFGAIVGRSGWHAAQPFPANAIPSRENRASPLEDLPGDWLTGETTPQRPVLAFKLVWH